MKEKIVIKLGGSALQNPDTLRQLALLVGGFQKRRYRVVIVHGGGPAINEELTRQNISWQFINGQRQTTPKMMGVIDEVLGKKVNGHLVQALRDEKIAAEGLSGADAKILFCTRASEELMQVGEVQKVNPAEIENLLQPFSAKVPVIAPIGYGVGGEKYNINADWAATKIAMALQAKKLIFLTDQNGILDGEKQLVSKATPHMIDKMIEDGVISGGMFTKVNAMTTALQAGIKQVRVLHASLASLVLTVGSIGTLLTEGHSIKGALHGRAS